MTNRRLFIASALLLACTLCIAEAQTASSLEVQATYTGAGPVDEKHKLYVVVWDNPNFQHGDPRSPIAVHSIASKQGSATFRDLKISPVYISLGYDPTGGWQAKKEPGLSVWLGEYVADDGKPKPVELHPGELTKISATLDNSHHRPPHANGK